MPVTIREVLHQLVSRSDCEVLPFSGMPALNQGDVLPEQLAEFYKLCGGIRIKRFNDCFYSWYVSKPTDFRAAVGVIHQGEMSDSERAFWSAHWANSFYVVAETEGSGEVIVTSCGDRFRGLYFDGHRETFGCDKMPVIAQSLAELIVLLVDAGIGSIPRIPPSRQKVARDFTSV
jgi:hypothetical protein